MMPTIPPRGIENDRSLISRRPSKPFVQVGRCRPRCCPDAWTRRNLDLFEVELAHLIGLGGHLFIPGQPGLALGLAALGVLSAPSRARPRAGFCCSFCVLLAGDLRAARRLLLQVDRVVALVRVRVAAVQFQDPLGHVVEEVPVVSDGDDGAGVLLEVLLEPEHALGVEVVGGLVEEQ